VIEDDHRRAALVENLGRRLALRGEVHVSKSG
jgi:hypothetical protein